MLKLEICLDEEQIIKDNIYDLEDMYRVIDELFFDEGLIKLPNENSSIFYGGTDSKKDLGRMFVCVFALEKSEWFMKYVKTWLFINNNNFNNNEDIEVIDIIEKNKAKNLKAII